MSAEHEFCENIPVPFSAPYYFGAVQKMVRHNVCFAVHYTMQEVKSNKIFAKKNMKGARKYIPFPAKKIILSGRKK